jgi:hypothetical protein
MSGISVAWSLLLALSDGFLCVIYTTAFPLFSPDSRVICSYPPNIVHMIEGILFLYNFK